MGMLDVPIGSQAVNEIVEDVHDEIQSVVSKPIDVVLNVTQPAMLTTSTRSFTPLVGESSNQVSLPPADGSMTEQARRLLELKERHDSECEYCTAVRGRIQTVFGEGNPDADIFFVGEAPGETEDRMGRPFVGLAGQKLDEMIRAIGLRREDCYIANIIKSRPPENRTPLPAEIERCGPYLVDQILIVNPKVIVTLGGPATKLLLKVDTGISKLRGVWAEWIPPSASGRGPIALMPTYHPNYLLRNYTTETRMEVWSDLKAVVRRITESPTV